MMARKPRKAPGRKAPVPGTAWTDKHLSDPQDLTTLPGWVADWPCGHHRCKAAFGPYPDHQGKCELTHDVWGTPYGDPERQHIGWDCNTPWCETHAGLWTGWQSFRDWRQSVLEGNKANA